MLVWSDIYSTGSALIDTQHKILLDKLNELELRLKKGELAKDEIDALLQFLNNYSRTHFSYEEQCMKLRKCAAFEENKAAHAEFMQNMEKQLARYTLEGCSKEFVQDLHGMMENWVKHHFLRIDTQLRPCVRR